MRLYLMRHAIAVDHGTPGYAQDRLRPLTEEGRTQARKVAAGLKRLKIEPDLIVTSPYVRAVQTAQEVARILQFKEPVQECDALRAEVYPAETSRALNRFSGYEQLLLIGHEPHMSSWLAELVAAPSGLHCVFKKAGVARVDLTDVPPPRGSGILKWLMTPKQLQFIGNNQ